MQHTTGVNRASTTTTTFGVGEPPPLSGDLDDIVAYMHHIGDRRRTNPSSR